MKSPLSAAYQSPEYRDAFRDRKYFRIRGEVVELDRVIVTDVEWAALPESSDPNWAVFRRAGLVFAARVLT
jgi:hypothetical protein